LSFLARDGLVRPVDAVLNRFGVRFAKLSSLLSMTESQPKRPKAQNLADSTARACIIVVVTMNAS
jgi:hypothetical protein